MEVLAWNVVLFAGGVVIITIAGLRMTAVADSLADRTGMGEALMGAVFVGATTSLSGSVMSIITAWHGHSGLAVSNALGGIGAQTAFLAVADWFYRKANLEHAAASESNLLQVIMLILLLTLPILGMAAPDWTFFHIHPVTFILMGAYFLGLRLVQQSRKKPMWRPKMTRETHPDEPEAKNLNKSLKNLWVHFFILAAAVSLSGWMLARAAIVIVESTGITATIMGGLFTAISTSIPELVVAVGAVRRGALTLAVGNIVGGNMYDTLIIGVSDFAYRDGSIYHSLQPPQLYMLALTLLLTSILMVGLLRREKHGVANIGLESVSVLVVYLLGFTLLFF